MPQSAPLPKAAAAHPRGTESTIAAGSSNSRSFMDVLQFLRCELRNLPSAALATANHAALLEAADNRGGNGSTGAAQTKSPHAHLFHARSAVHHRCSPTIDGTKPYDLPSANLYIFRYSNIHGWVDIAATGLSRAVVFDEVQELRNGTATTKGGACEVFAQSAGLRVGLSATPVFNYGSEIFNIYKFISPQLLGNWEDFCREWCRMGPGGKASSEVVANASFDACARHCANEHPTMQQRSRVITDSRLRSIAGGKQ